MITRKTLSLIGRVLRARRVVEFWLKAPLISPLSGIQPGVPGRLFDWSEDIYYNGLQMNSFVVGCRQ